MNQGLESSEPKSKYGSWFSCYTGIGSWSEKVKDPDIQNRKYDPKWVMAIFAIVFLTIADAFLTIHLVETGATELNPILAYYLSHSPTFFFVVKYFLTGASIFLILAGERIYRKRMEVVAKLLIMAYMLILGFVVQWQLYLILK